MTFPDVINVVSEAGNVLLSSVVVVTNVLDAGIVVLFNVVVDDEVSVVTEAGKVALSSVVVVTYDPLAGVSASVPVPVGSVNVAAPPDAMLALPPIVTVLAKSAAPVDPLSNMLFTVIQLFPDVPTCRHGFLTAPVAFPDRVTGP